MSRYESEEQIKIKRERAELEVYRQEMMSKALTELMQLQSFKMIMSDIIAKAGIFQSVMTGNSATYYKAGRQDFGKEIFDTMLKADPQGAFDLLKPQKV